MLAALQKQRISASGNERNIQQNVQQTTTQVHSTPRVDGDVIQRAYAVSNESIHEASHIDSTIERLVRHEPEPLTTINEQLLHHHTNSAGTDEPNTQVSTDDGTLEFNVNELDESKLFELQNVIRELEGKADFEQLLDSNFKPQLINASSGTMNVNVDQIPQEAVYMSIGRLLDTGNVDMPSLSQGTQEQLMWLVNKLNNNRSHQDEDEDEADDDDDDDDKSKSILPLLCQISTHII